MHAIRGGGVDWQTPVSKNTGQTNFDQTCRERLRQAIWTGGKFLPDLVCESSTQSRTKLTRCGVSFRAFASSRVIAFPVITGSPSCFACWVAPYSVMPSRPRVSLHKMAQDFRAAANPQARLIHFQVPLGCEMCHPLGCHGPQEAKLPELNLVSCSNRQGVQ
jgi:hypothetical protein